MHRRNCSNLTHAKQQHDQWLEIDWQPDPGEEFRSLILVQMENRRGLLASIANAIAKLDINIEHLHIKEKNHSMRALSIAITIPNTNSLELAIKEIKNIEFVHSVTRSST